MNRQNKVEWGQVIRPAIIAIIFFTLVTGLLYPSLITGVAHVVFPYQANGSLIRTEEGTIIGSELIGQQFSDPAYFWGRPSATSPVPYNAEASSGSNLGPQNPALIGEDGMIQGRIDALQAANEAAGVTVTAPIPVDLVTASGSGLDPHISVAAAEYQIPRIAALRGLEDSVVRELVAQHTDGRQLGILGEARVNVLQLNLALDALNPSL